MWARWHEAVEARLGRDEGVEQALIRRYWREGAAGSVDVRWQEASLLGL